MELLIEQCHQINRIIDHQFIYIHNRADIKEKKKIFIKFCGRLIQIADVIKRSLLYLRDYLMAI